MKDRFPKWWLPYYVVRTLFLRFGVITLVLLAPLFTLYVANGDYVIGSDYVFLFSLWFMLFAPFAINYGIAKKRKKRSLLLLRKSRRQGISTRKALLRAGSSGKVPTWVSTFSKEPFCTSESTRAMSWMSLASMLTA